MEAAAAASPGPALRWFAGATAPSPASAWPRTGLGPPREGSRRLEDGIGGLLGREDNGGCCKRREELRCGWQWAAGGGAAQAERQAGSRRFAMGQITIKRAGKRPAPNPH